MTLAKTRMMRIIGALPVTLFQSRHKARGRSSVVEHLVANENVVSSNLIARSISLGNQKPQRPQSAEIVL